MRWSDRPDAASPASGHMINATCFRTVNCRSDVPQSRTGRADAHFSSHACPSLHSATRRAAQSDRTLHHWSPVVSSKVPKRQNHDRTRPITGDRTQTRVRSLLACSDAFISVRHHLTRHNSCASGPSFSSASGQGTEGSLHCAPLTGRRVRVRSLPKAESGQYKIAPFDPKLHHP